MHALSHSGAARRTAVRTRRTLGREMCFFFVFFFIIIIIVVVVTECFGNATYDVMRINRITFKLILKETERSRELGAI